MPHAAVLLLSLLAVSAAPFAVERADAAGLVERDGTSGVETALKDLFSEAGIERSNT